jgi:hypothetical protein
MDILITAVVFFALGYWIHSFITRMMLMYWMRLFQAAAKTDNKAPELDIDDLLYDDSEKKNKTSHEVILLTHEIIQGEHYFYVKDPSGQESFVFQTNVFLKSGELFQKLFPKAVGEFSHHGGKSQYNIIDGHVVPKQENQ